MINGSIHQQDVTITIIYTLNIGFPKYIKQMVKHLKRRGRLEHNNSGDSISHSNNGKTTQEKN
jgi:hypothetical protein